MADFFGFDPSLPTEEGGAIPHDESIDLDDANDETFGAISEPVVGEFDFEASNKRLDINDTTLNNNGTGLEV